MRGDLEPALDFFLAHAGPDSPAAEDLARALQHRGATVFDDSMIEVGVDWDLEIVQRLNDSRLIVVLVSTATPAAHYQRAEIARAIELARNQPHLRRVVPIALGDVPRSELPYGLETKHGLVWRAGQSPRHVVEPLLSSLRDLKKSPTYGPYQEACQATALLLALDEAALGIPITTDDELGHISHRLLNEALVSCAATASAPLEVEHLRHVLNDAGMDPRVLIEQLPDHEEAVKRWLTATERSARSNTDRADRSLEVCRAIPTALRAILIDALRDASVFATLSSHGRGHLIHLLVGASPSPRTRLSEFAATIASTLPPLRSISRDIVVVQSKDPGLAAPSASGLALRYAAHDLCRLPSPDPDFTGRDDLLSTILSAARTALQLRNAASIVLSGAPGIGTSSVGIEVARALGDGFTGGVLYVDLGGLDHTARRSAQTAVRLISAALALGSEEHEVTETQVIRNCVAALDGKRVLVVLDNAGDADHVGELARAAQSCVVIVTSRQRVHEYADRGCRIQVGPLSHEAAVALLRRYVGDDCVDVEPLSRIAELCENLPLALRLYGARMASRTDIEISEHAELLASEVTRLDYLAHGKRGMRAALQLSYDNLDVDSQRTLRVLGAIPPGHVVAEELATCLKIPLARALALLHRLVDASLAERPAVWKIGRRPRSMFRLSDLTRLFATERLSDEQEADVICYRQASLEYLSSCVDVADDADAVYRAMVADPARWHSALQMAAAHGWHDVGLRLGSTLKILLHVEQHAERYVSVCQIVAHMTTQASGPSEAVRGLMRDAELLLDSLSHPAGALVVLQSALELSRRTGSAEFDAEIHFRTSLAQAAQERWREALEAGSAALSAFEARGLYAATVVVAMNNSRAASQIGDAVGALNYARRAWDRTYLVDGDRKSSAAFDLARALSLNRLPSDALVMWREAARLYEEQGDYVNAGVACESGVSDAPSHEVAASLCESAADHHIRGASPLRAASCLLRLAEIRLLSASGRLAMAAIERASTLVASGSIERSDIELRLVGAQMMCDPLCTVIVPEIVAGQSPQMDRLHLLLVIRARGDKRATVASEIISAIGARPSWTPNGNFVLDSSYDSEPTSPAVLSK